MKTKNPKHNPDNIKNGENKTPTEDTSITQKKAEDNFDFLQKKAKSARIKEKIIGMLRKGY